MLGYFRKKETLPAFRRMLFETIEHRGQVYGAWSPEGTTR